MRSIFLILVLVFIVGCSEEIYKDDGKTYHQAYKTGKIEGLNEFIKLDKNELSLDSMFEGKFKEGRSRAFFEHVYEHDSGKYQPMPCNCVLKHDSLIISTASGFFGGSGINIIVKDTSFVSSFFTYTDGNYYKTSLSDTGFSREASVKSKYQYLVFKETPAFKVGQQLTGYLTLTSDYFYTLGIPVNTTDSNFVTVKMFFTCKTKKR